MEYRINQRTKDRISVIGIGSSYLSDATESEAVQALELAYEKGVNYIDMAAGAAECFGYYGKVFEKVRRDMLYQIHFGADYSTGKYGWSLDPDRVKRSVDWQLGQLRTDYIDYGFIHCMDEEGDWKTYRKNGVLDKLLRLKEEGVVRHIGLSSHTPRLVNRVLDEGIVDMLMFSINPGYDYQEGEYANGSVNERDYSVSGTFAPADAAGKCVYCSHCQPCPAGIDIALINKYYDLARIGDDMAAGHYRKLELHASDCIRCGHCDSRCPFGVEQSKRMEQIAGYFGC